MPKASGSSSRHPKSFLLVVGDPTSMALPLSTPFAINPPLDHRWSRLDGVDLLRGLAILFVLMNHVHMRLFLAGIPYTDGLPDPLVRSLVWNGQQGVQIFFAVSGFLITSMSLRRWNALPDVSLRGFYLMRFARIAPCSFCCS